LPNAALAVFLLAYFLFFNWDGLRVHFALDDIGNMAHYYRDGPWWLAASQFLPWRGYYRPMGGLFYVPILHFSGLNPAPYQAALLLLLLANVYLVHRLARLLGCGELAAALAALVVCYHAGLSNLYYNAAFVYDALCGFFYVGTLVYYIRLRRAGRLPGWGEKAVLLALFLCALNSKEMAVTLPVMLLVYEWIYHRRDGSEHGTDSRPAPGGTPVAEKYALVGWLRGPGQTVLLASVLGAVDVFGKVWGAEPLIQAEGYRPVFNLQGVRAFQRMSLGDLLFGWGSGWGGILLLWAVLGYLAWRRAGRPELRFLWWFLVITPLPIEFLVGKSQACLYVPMIGWAIFGASVFADLVFAAAGVLEREVFFRPLGRAALVALLVAGGVFVWARINLDRKNLEAEPRMAALGRESWDVIRQFRAANPQVRPGSSVAFLDDPFHSWDMLFVAELWFHDRSLKIHVAREGALGPRELAKMDAIFTFQGGELVRLK
jgi:hypothetical protein